MIRRTPRSAGFPIALLATASLIFPITTILAVEPSEAAESPTKLESRDGEKTATKKSFDGIGLSVADYPSVQAAIDANPGRIVYVPSGEYRITEKIRIRGNGGGLQGPGIIVQTNAEHPIVEIEAASDVLLRDIHLSRPAESATTGFEGILAIDCRDLVIENVRITDNRTRSASIRLHRTQNCRISRCVIENYSRLSIDDRTANTQLYGYAFHCIDGTGIGISESTGTLIEFNRVQENHLRPTREIRDQYRLGHFAKKNSEKPPGMNPDVWAAEYVDNWHQGSAILVTSPAVTRNTRIVGNLILNAAQGIDLHCDHVTVSGNMVENAFVGMKAMHGSRNVLIIGNQFSKNDLWAIGLMPGATSKAGNTDGGSVIANNIISEFGYGDSNWVWGNTRSPLRFDRGQIESNPPLTDVLVQGNVIDSEGPPRFEYSVIIEHGTTAPKNLRFIGNMFTPGTSGACNQSLP